MGADDMDDMGEIVAEFLVESYENLDQLDRDLVALEREPGSRELLASVFRTIHTIKGTSGFLAFSHLERVTHVGENLLSRLRDGRLTLTAARTDALLAMVDTVRGLLAAIEATGAEGEADLDPVLAALTAALEDAPAETADSSPAPEPLPAPEQEPASAPIPAAPEVVAPAPAAASGAAPEVAAPEVVAPEPEPAAAPGRRVADGSIRVDVGLLDSLMALVGELVLTRNQMVQYADDVKDPASVQALLRSIQRFSVIASELQEDVMKTRMQPIDAAWSKLPRVVRDLAASCGKAVRLQMSGRETELDRTLLEAIRDPLTHIVRNSVDHGIETPDARVAAGKPAEGLLRLSAYHEGGQVIVEVDDDGAGIDPAKVAATALARGVRTTQALAAMTERQIVDLVFAPGFSTAAAVTNVSGRGVGMDVVRTNIENIGGTVELETRPGAGTTVRLTIPLTLAIVPALTVVCAGQRYAIPQVSLLELVSLGGDRAGAHGVEDLFGSPVYRLRGSLLPLVYLDEALGLPAGSRTSAESFIAVLAADGRRFGLVVDRVLNTEEIVVKSLGSRLKSIGVYAGATILGDGAVALILDVASLARRALLSTGDGAADPLEADQAPAAASVAEPVLVVGIADGRRVAVPLQAVTRLEAFTPKDIERLGDREVVQYRGQIVPVLRLDALLGATGSPYDETVRAIILAGEAGTAALVVDEIVDIAEREVDPAAERPETAAVIRDRVTELFDVRRASRALAAGAPLDADAAADAAEADDVDTGLRRDAEAARMLLGLVG